MNEPSVTRGPAGRATRYVFLDGPLARRVMDSTDVHLHGERIDVEVVDVGQSCDDMPRHGYAVDPPARPGRRGGLRYIGPTPDASSIPA